MKILKLLIDVRDIHEAKNRRFKLDVITVNHIGTESVGHRDRTLYKIEFNRFLSNYRIKGSKTATTRVDYNNRLKSNKITSNKFIYNIRPKNSKIVTPKSDYSNRSSEKGTIKPRTSSGKGTVNKSNSPTYNDRTGEKDRESKKDNFQNKKKP